MARLDPAAFITHYSRLGTLPLWPGFEPLRVPVLVYDGERTFLVNHPRPPSDFAPVPGLANLWSFEGRHPAAVANTADPVEGVLTAILMLSDRGEADPFEAAAIAVHEAFHVFQAERHPDWGANEAEALTYPVEDPELLAWRRLETAALRRALDEGGDPAPAALEALTWRERRRARLSEGAAGYESGLERFEGLAQYVESRARAAPPGLPAADFPPDEVRRRAYLTGQALAVLLDRLDPGWAGSVEAGETAPLDQLLGSALARRGPAAPTSADDQAAALARAAADVATLLADRERRRAAFDALPGWRVEVVSETEPLWPQGFDPMNLHRLGGAEVLHGRYLRLGNDAGWLEVLGGQAISEAAGAHPLFSGVHRVTVGGLASEPRVERDGDRVRLAAPGLSVDLATDEVGRPEAQLLRLVL